MAMRMIMVSEPKPEPKSKSVSEPEAHAHDRGGVERRRVDRRCDVDGCGHAIGDRGADNDWGRHGGLNVDTRGRNHWGRGNDGGGRNNGNGRDTISSGRRRYINGIRRLHADTDGDLSGGLGWNGADENERGKTQQDCYFVFHRFAFH